MDLNKKSIRTIPLINILSLSLLMGFGFTNCSDVSFSKGADSVSKTGGPGGGGTHSYVFDQVIAKLGNKVDIFFIIDNSGSMDEEREKLAERMDGLVASLNAKAVDWQMCWTTTDRNDFQDNSLYWQVKNSSGNYSDSNRRVLKYTDNDVLARYADTMKSLETNSGSGDERGIAAASEAVKRSSNSECFRDDAALAFVLISDEDEASTGLSGGRILPDESNPNKFIALTGSEMPGKPIRFNSIVVRPGDSPCKNLSKHHNYGTEYQKLQQLTNGVLGSVCDASYADQLVGIGENAGQSTKINSVTLQCQVEGAPAVTLIPDAGLTYTVQSNKIVFNDYIPGGTRVIVNYDCPDKG